MLTKYGFWHNCSRGACFYFKLVFFKIRTKTLNFELHHNSTTFVIILVLVKVERQSRHWRFESWYKI